ncbi:hypothetical protein FOA52_015909 [Chlamydomonas sp. UWO 241]|nr:hypothetical protein FOA52_015909 [Chlamydomonas sp. UWO 241]
MHHHHGHVHGPQPCNHAAGRACRGCVGGGDARGSVVAAADSSSEPGPAHSAEPAAEAEPASPSSNGGDGGPAQAARVFGGQDSEAARAASVRQTEAEDAELCKSFSVPQAVLDANALLVEDLRGELILAPLTRGNHGPFRAFCMKHGCRVTMSEMAFGKELVKGIRGERARLRRVEGEDMYGLQIATKTIAEGLAASALAKASGARWMDLNCGCPIHEASRRGVGAIMLSKPAKLARLVNGIVRESELPLTVKIRLGESERKINVERVTRLLKAAGAAAVIIHGRTMEQRYRKPASWDHISAIAKSPDAMPVIGNGDVLTHYEARRRIDESGCLAVMVGRGALIKPWIFREFRDNAELPLDAAARVGMYRELYGLMRAHFGDDEMGRKKAWYFAPWHHDFFHRYRSLPGSVYEQQSHEHALIMTRTNQPYDLLLGETSLDALDPIERLLRNESPDAHGAIAAALWDSPSDAECMAALGRLADLDGPRWEAEARAGGERGGGRSPQREADERG